MRRTLRTAWLAGRPPRKKSGLRACLLAAGGAVLVIALASARNLPSDSNTESSIWNGAFYQVLKASSSIARSLDLIPMAFAEKGGNGNGNGGGNGNAGGNGNGNGNAGGNGNGNAGGNGNGNGNSNAGGVGKAKGKATADSGDVATGMSISALDGEPTKTGATSSSGRDFRPNEVLVVDASQDALDQARQMGFGLVEERRLPALGMSIYRLRTPGNLGALRGLALLQSAMPQIIADVDSLYQPYVFQGTDISTAEVASLPSSDFAWRLIGWSGGAACGGGLRVGMIDSAVDADAESLAQQRLHQASFVSAGDAAPDTRHGTAIASLLVGRGGSAGHAHWQGLLPSADLYAAAVFERQGSNSIASAVAIAEALDWMAANQVSIINISLSGESNLLVAAAVRRTAARGGIMIAAAGNGGPTAGPSYPGAYRDVIAVTAVDQNAAVFQDANRGDYIDFAAPGVRVWAPGGGSFGQYLTGTSFAAPFVTAAAAVTMADGTVTDLPAVRQQLAAHAVHLGSPGKNSIYGYGLLKVLRGCDTKSASAL
jgi:hypothetical protein